MKIRNINFINNSPKIFENHKEQRNPYVQFDNFSKEYSDAIKSLNFSFKSKISEVKLKQKCDELKKELLTEGVIQSEDEISWYTDYYANEANIQIAKKVFSDENLKNCERDILKTTNEENLATASYICNNPFPLQYVFNILLATRIYNSEASLAMCQSEDIPKDIIDKLLPSIKSFNNRAVAKIALDENYPKKDKVRSIGTLNVHNSSFIEELLNDKDFPRDDMMILIEAMKTKKDTLLRQEFYRVLLANSNNSKKEIADAVSRINAGNEKALKEFCEYFQKNGALNLQQTLNAFNCARHKKDILVKIKAYETIAEQENLNSDELSNILRYTSDLEDIKFGLEYLKKYPDFPQELKELFLSDYRSLLEARVDSDKSDLYESAKNLGAVYNMLMANPELYINGEVETKEEAQDEIKGYIEENFYELIEFAKIMDKNTIEFLFRKRLDAVDDALLCFDDLENVSKQLLKEMLKCNNSKGLELTSKEKLTLLNILAGYEACNASINEIELSERIDVENLEHNLLRHVFRFCGMSNKEIKTIPKEIISKWNINYAHLLALQERIFFNDGDNSLGYIIRAISFGKDFKTYIQGDNYFGAINFATKEKFEQFGLNYENWLNPSKDCEVQFKYIDINQAMLAQIAGQIEEDIEVLRKTPAKNFIDKHFSDCIIDGKFKIADKYKKDKQTLEVFTKGVFELLDRNVFSRAQMNLDNPDKNKNAHLTLTIKNHLEQRLKDISKCETKKKEKTIDLTIKMWDRNPIHDLFQGNYSTCCIGLGESNGIAMPTYLLSTMFNMIELVDNSTGETIGNALCYFAFDEINEPKFIIDNIEIANKYKMSDDASDKFLNEVIGYCINLLKTLSNKNIPILMGTSFNDVNDEEISVIEMDYLRILGDMNYEMTYLDAFNGWGEGVFDSSESSEKLELLYLADSRQDEEILDDKTIDEWF